MSIHPGSTEIRLYLDGMAWATGIYDGVADVYTDLDRLRQTSTESVTDKLRRQHLRASDLTHLDRGCKRRKAAALIICEHVIHWLWRYPDGPCYRKLAEKYCAKSWTPSCSLSSSESLVPLQ